MVFCCCTAPSVAFPYIYKRFHEFVELETDLFVSVGYCHFVFRIVVNAEVLFMLTSHLPSILRVGWMSARFIQRNDLEGGAER